MSEFFEEKIEEAKEFLDEGLPYWSDDFFRPNGELFANYLKDRGYDVYYLYFICSWEGVFAPLSYQPRALKKVALTRAKERERGILECDLSFM